jgi:hypothetical protein
MSSSSPCVQSIQKHSVTSTVDHSSILPPIRMALPRVQIEAPMQAPNRLILTRPHSHADGHDPADKDMIGGCLRRQGGRMRWVGDGLDRVSRPPKSPPCPYYSKSKNSLPGGGFGLGAFGVRRPAAKALRIAAALLRFLCTLRVAVPEHVRMGRKEALRSRPGGYPGFPVELPCSLEVGR